MLSWPMLIPLHEIVATRRDEIVRRWTEQVRGTLASESFPTPELVDHIPRFLDEIAAGLRETALTGHPPKLVVTAPGHGEQRLRLGFSLDSVVREYGMLRAAIIDVAMDADSPPALDELHVVFDLIIDGISHAVTEYARHRDAEMQRQANEHFAFVAHELRNPVGSAMTALELLRSPGTLPPDEFLIGSLERSLRHVKKLIDESLRVARFASGIDLRREWVTLDDLAAELELGARPEARAKGMDLIVHLTSHERVFLDRRLVSSAVGNLLHNAIKFTRPAGAVELRMHVDGARLIIEVADCCGGLPPGEVEQAFSPFVRLDAEREGFGLGLSIAKQAVDAHGGAIRVQNLPRKGCVFALELPVGDEGPGA